MGKKIPAIYLGTTPIRFSAHHGEVLDGDGKPLTERTITTGQTVMMPEEEVLGMTIKFDPRGVLDPVKVGVGRCVMAEHAELSPEELEVAGYQFHEGRRDFISVAQAEAEKAKAEAAKKTDTKQAAAGGAPVKKEESNGPGPDQK